MLKKIIRSDIRMCLNVIFCCSDFTIFRFFFSLLVAAYICFYHKEPGAVIRTVLKLHLCKPNKFN